MSTFNAKNFFSQKDIGGLSDEEFRESLKKATDGMKNSPITNIIKPMGELQSMLDKDEYDKILKIIKDGLDNKIKQIDETDYWLQLEKRLNIKLYFTDKKITRVIRLKDNTDFKIGDYVTNGTKMKGQLMSFDYGKGADEIFVITDWSGIGMNLNSLKHTSPLPCIVQIGEVVDVHFGKYGEIKCCQVLNVKFTENKILYDVEVGSGCTAIVDNTRARIYNIEERFVTKISS